MLRCLGPHAGRNELIVLQVFELNPVRAWGAVITSLVSMAASLYLISVSPWYLLPFAWALAGTAFTGVCSQDRLLCFCVDCQENDARDAVTLQVDRPC